MSRYAPVHASAARLCTCSIEWDINAGQLSYIIHPYSIMGRMKVRYIFSFTILGMLLLSLISMFNVGPAFFMRLLI